MSEPLSASPLGLAAATPAPPTGRLWHDRRPRPTHLLRRTRPSEADVARMWAWVQSAAGLHTD